MPGFSELPNCHYACAHVNGNWPMVRPVSRNLKYTWCCVYINQQSAIHAILVVQSLRPSAKHYGRSSDLIARKMTDGRPLFLALQKTYTGFVVPSWCLYRMAVWNKPVIHTAQSLRAVWFWLVGLRWVIKVSKLEYSRYTNSPKHTYAKLGNNQGTQILQSTHMPN